MPFKYRNKYRIESSRMKHWDYRWNGAYFVTICTKHRECYFGKVVNGDMVLNDAGIIARDCWIQIPEHFPYVILGDHVVMPNHIHGIIVIDNPAQRSVETPDLGVSTNPSQPTNPPHPTNSEYPPERTRAASKKWKSGSLGVIINQYKRAVTVNVKRFNQNFAWQPRFHDRIIRNDGSLERISVYVQENPKNWG